MRIEAQIRMLDSVAYHDASTAWNVMVLMDSGNVAPCQIPQARLERTQAQLAKARKVIEVQGNVSALLGELLEPRDAQESTER